MVNFKSLIAKSAQINAERAAKEAQFASITQRAEPLPPSAIVLPGDDAIPLSPEQQQAANFMQNKTAIAPKIKINHKVPGRPKTLGELLKKKAEPATAPVAPAPVKKRSMLFGTGITKRIAQRAETTLRKGPGEVALQTATAIIHEREKETPPEQPPIIAIPKPSDITWDKYQLQALTEIKTQRFSVLIGSAGTGKTTVTKQIIEDIKSDIPTIDLNLARTKQDVKPDYNVAICFVAYIGRAVQQMKKVIPAEYHPMCNTAHATLGYMPTKEEYHDDKKGYWREKLIFRPTFTATNKLPYKVCVLDEAGTMPITLWNELIAALPHDVKIIMIGDINQLTPVQGRSVLGFAMINWPTFTLEKIHRQAADNPIIANAHRVLRGLYPKPDPEHFVMMKIPDGSIGAANDTIGIVKKLHSMQLFDPFVDGLIVPQNIGNLGQLDLNERLVEYFNPPIITPDGVRINTRTIIASGKESIIYAIGDKVMLLENDRQRELTNGMIGKVVNIIPNTLYQGESNANIAMQKFSDNFDIANFQLEMQSISTKSFSTNPDDDEENQRQASHILTMEFESGKEIKFQTVGQYKKMTHAYAATCHKFQGDERRHVVIICHASNIRMLTREWLYTAITRGVEKVFLLYNDRGLTQAINVQKIKGNTVEEKANQFIALQDKSDTSLPMLPKPRRM